jgi:hypothetical protein
LDLEVIVLDRNFLKKVIDEAATTFVRGNIIRKTLTTQIKTGLKKDAAGRIYKIEQTAYPRLVEEAYADTDANTIPGSNFIASYGPRTQTLENFIESIVLNETYPVKQIIALGACLAYGQWEYQDFFDYCVVPDSEIPREAGKYKLEIPAPHGQYSQTESHHQTFPNSFLQTTVRITSPGEQHRAVKVTVLPLDDNASITFTEDDELPGPPGYSSKRPIKYQQMWQLFAATCQERTLVHCAAGVGRTGHLILTFEILRHYHHIFASSDPKICAQKIHDILTRMRFNRPCLVNVEQQFCDAIANAVSLYNYACSKQYKLEEYILPVGAQEDVVPTCQQQASPRITPTPQTPAVSYYAEKFAPFSKDPDGNKAPRRSETELRLFHKELGRTNSAEQIQTLLTIAEPYLNRHMNPKVDKKVGIVVTGRWNACIQAARTRALELVRSKIDLQGKQALPYIAGLRDLNLFSMHRKRLSFGRTNAQKSIDTMIKTLRPGN